MNVAFLVVMIDFVIIVATPFLKTKWDNLMASIKEAMLYWTNLGYMHFVWQSGRKWKLIS
jgi:hypothetical protein